MDTPAARLEVVAGKATGMSILVDDQLLIGRHTEGAGRLADDEELSRAHARVSLEPNGFCAIEDLGSTNGTFVNGLRLSSPQTLSAGDTIELGGTTMVVRELPGNLEDSKGSSGTLQPTVVPRAILTATEGATPTEVQEPAAVQEPPRVPHEPPAAPPPPLSLHLVVDFATRAARILLEGDSEPIPLAFENGKWRAISGPPPTEGQAP